MNQNKSIIMKIDIGKLLLKKLILVFSLTFTIAYSYSDSYNVEKLGIELGLSDDHVMSITQDRDGFIWFATEWGLSRLDGRSFKSFKFNPANDNSIGDNALNKVLYDEKNNKLWIATQSAGLNAFDFNTHRFIRYPIWDDTPHSIRANGITSLCIAEDGNLWIGTYQNGLKKLNVKNNEVNHFTDSELEGLSLLDIWDIADDMNGNLYIGLVNKGLAVYSQKEKLIKYFYHNPLDSKSLPNNRVSRVFIDSKKNVWLGTVNGLALFRPENENFIIFKKDINNPNGLTDNDIQSIQEVDNNQLWIGTDKGGINILELNTDIISNPELTKFKHLKSNDLPTKLFNPIAKDIFQDSFGNIWIGTFGGALNFISHLKPFFNQITYTTIRNDQNALSNKAAWTVCSDNKDQLWIGTEGGGIDVFVNRNKVAHYSKELRNLPDNNLITSLVDSRGNIWFGANKEGLLLYNEKKDHFNKIELFSNVNLNNQIWCLYEDNEQNIWIGSNQGLIKLNPITQEKKEFDGRSIGIMNNLIRSISQDKNGNIWIGSLIDGLSIINPQHELIYNTKHINYITHIYRDSKDRMWVGSRTGLARFDSGDDYEFKFYSQQNGLADSYVRAIIEGKEDELWFSTNTGISRYFVNKNLFENYDYQDGIPYGSFMNGAVTKRPDGTVFFGSQAGICYFNPENKNDNYSIPKTVITNFSIYDTKEIQLNNSINIPVAPIIHLAYNENTLTIEFNLMDYALKNQVDYSYSLKGIDDRWYQTNGENQVTFRNLSPGDYTFLVRARLRNQNWSTDITSMQFIISPPFWLSWWAKTFYLIIAALILIGLIRFYLRRLNLENELQLEKRKHQQEQDLNDEKFRFYTNVAHELRTPLTLIIGPLGDLLIDKEMKDEQAKKISLIHRSSVRLSNLINQILEYRKSETQNRELCVTYGDASKLIQETVLKFKELSKNKNVVIETHIESNLPFYYDPEVLTIILDNLVSNAIKYTEEGSITIVLRDIRCDSIDYKELEVTDTGHGISTDALNKVFDLYFQAKNEYQAYGSGIGLALVKNLVKLHEGTINVKSELNKGTSFFVRLKIDNTYPEVAHMKPESTTQDIKPVSAPILLVVEDNADIRDYIADSFVDSFTIYTAENGKKGVELAFDKLPDIIISDIRMPVMDGIELCKILKGNIRTSHIPIILLTAKGSERDKTEGYSTGADSYLTKPFSVSLLRTRINNLFESRKRINEYFSTNLYKKAISSNALNQLDNDFIEKTISYIVDNIDSEQISTNFLAEQLNMSYSTFSRKIKALTGSTANELIRKLKMQHAEQLLLSRKYSITEVAYQVGYSSTAHFRDYFKAEFGVSPSGYLKKIEENDS